MSFQACNLTFGYGRAPALLQNFSLELSRGDFIGLIGPNGSGKSTILKLLTGMLRPRGGAVWCDGVRLDKMDPVSRSGYLAAVPQNWPPMPDYEVETMVEVGRAARISGWFGPSGEDRAAVERAMADLNLLHLRHRRCGCISGGEFQRVMIAMALAQQSRYLLLDEPTSALDIAHSNDLMKQLQSLSTQRNLGVLLISHDLQLAARYCKYLILLKHGSVVGAGAPEEVLTSEHLQRTFDCRAEICKDSAGHLLISPE